MAGNMANRTVKITYEFGQKNAQIAQNVQKLVKGTTHQFKGLSHQTKNTESMLGKITKSFKSFHMELLGLGFGFAMIGMIFSGFVTKALNEYMKLTKWGDALGFSWLNMQGAIQTLGYHIISFASETLQSLFDGVEDIINKFMDFDASVGGAASSLLVLVGAAALILSPLAFFGLFLFSVGQLLIKTSEFMITATAAAGGLKASLGLLGAAAFIAVGAFQMFQIGSNIMGQSSGKAKGKVDTLSTALGALNWVMSLVIVASGGLIYAVWMTSATIAAAVKTIMEVGRRWLDAYNAITISLVKMFEFVAAAAVDMWNAIVSGKAPSRSIDMMKTLAAAVDVATTKLAKAADIGAVWTDNIGEMKEMLNEATGASSDFGKSMQSALNTISGGSLYPGLTAQTTATTSTPGTTTGVPGGVPSATMPAYPQELADFLNEGGGLSSVDVNINIEDSTNNGISMRGEVLTSDEKASATLNQLGVRA